MTGCSSAPSAPIEASSGHRKEESATAVRPREEDLSEEKILTLHPQGKRGVRIQRGKYDLMREAVLSCLQAGELTHDQLFAAVEQRLGGCFDGSIPWYAETLKLDLEARGEIERVTNQKPTRYRIKGK